MKKGGNNEVMFFQHSSAVLIDAAEILFKMKITLFVDNVIVFFKLALSNGNNKHSRPAHGSLLLFKNNKRVFVRIEFFYRDFHFSWPTE